MINFAFFETEDRQIVMFDGDRISICTTTQQATIYNQTIRKNGKLRKQWSMTLHDAERILNEFQ